MIVYIYNIGVDLYNGFNGLRHRINWTYFTVLDGLAHPLYSFDYGNFRYKSNILQKINNIESNRYKKDEKNINDELDRIDVLFYSHMEWLLKETKNW